MIKKKDFHSQNVTIKELGMDMSCAYLFIEALTKIRVHEYT
jgi:hypothetical protein